MWESSARAAIQRRLLHLSSCRSFTSYSRLRVAAPGRQNSLSAAYYRGGTSRAIMFNEAHLPKDRSHWGPIFLGAIGSPDSNGRQLDGMGGGISSLSKVCVVGKSTRPADADVDYTFIALGVKTSEVDFSSNCGNMTSAIGPFATDAGIVPSPPNGSATVRIYNTNTSKLIDATFPVVDGEAASCGDFAIDGVEGTAARIQLAFLDPAGSRTDKLLPTGNACDEIDGIKVSLIDCGNPCCFVSAEDLNVDGTILPDAAEAHRTLLPRLDKIRRQASVMMGLSTDTASAAGSVPKIAFLSKPSTHTVLSGQTIKGSDVDLVVRAISVAQPHKAVPITVAMAIAAAEKVEGSTINLLRGGALGVDPNGLTLGHASGKVTVGAKFDETGLLTAATVYRTARRLMNGTVYWK